MLKGLKTLRITRRQAINTHGDYKGQVRRRDSLNNTHLSPDPGRGGTADALGLSEEIPLLLQRLSGHRLAFGFGGFGAKVTGQGSASQDALAFFYRFPSAS